MKSKELEILKKMMGNDYLDGMDNLNSHLNDLSSDRIITANNAATNKNEVPNKEKSFHKGNTKNKTKTFLNDRFKLDFPNLLTIEETTSTNNRVYAVAIEIITHPTIIALFAFYSIIN
jgi:hypothetical protein